MLRPQKNITKILISSTSRFTGEFKENGILITHAWTERNDLGLHENPMSKNYFIISHKIPDIDDGEVVVPNYSATGDIIATYLGILFGKRFDNHERIESLGHFFMPFNTNSGIPCNSNLPFNSHSERKDVKIPLQLNQFEKIYPLLQEPLSNEKFCCSFKTAGRFYLQAIQKFEIQPESAYLDLITCGEILSNFYEYDKELLLDEQLKADLEKIKTLQNGNKIQERVLNRLFQVKKKFVTTIMKLLTINFFSYHEASKKLFALRKDNIEKSIKSAYDLRSQYVHTGSEFGHLMLPTKGNFEIQIGKPKLESETLSNTIFNAPTFLGLERIMRYCLLRFVHLNGCRIDNSLDGEGLI